MPPQSPPRSASAPRSSCCRCTTRSTSRINGRIWIMSAMAARSSGSGLGRDHHYEQFQTPREGRVRRFREGVELIKALWTEEKVDLPGPHLPARRRHDGAKAGAEAAAADLDGGRAPGRAAPHRRDCRWLDGLGRIEQSPPSCAPSRCCARRWRRRGATRRTSRSRSGCFCRCMSVRRSARAELHRWFTVVYRNPEGTDASGIHGTPEQVRNGWRSWSPPAPTTCCSIRPPATPNSWRCLAAVVGLS